jgi:FtsH-binding integral membrane protein
MNQDEKRFVEYWKVQRLKKKQFLRKKSIGLPLGVLIVLALAVSLFSGWYQKADMVLRSNSSLIVVIMIASVGIVVFITLFAARHQWDQNELKYQELVGGEKDDDAAES